MEPSLWIAVAILGTLLTVAMFFLATRIDHMASRIDALGDRLTRSRSS